MNDHLTQLFATKVLKRPSASGRSLGFAFLAAILSPSTLHAENAVEDKKLEGSEQSSFGTAAAISGDVALLGAPTDTGATLPESGAAYLYRKEGANWALEAKLVDPDGQESDFFGLSVAVSGEVAIVGAPADDDFGGQGGDILLNSGSAFVFRYNGTTWELEQKLTASAAAANDLFGFSVAISGNVALIGADENQDGPGGSAYVFRYNGTTWVEEQILTGQPGADDNFGISVAVSGNVAMVGASPASETPKPGSAYVFRHTDDGAWIRERELSASDKANGDLFGESVSISGERAIVGAYGAGQAYLFDNTSDTPWLVKKLIDRTPSPEGNNFGFTVAISGEVALVTAPTKPREGVANVGSGILYRLTDDENAVWSESEFLPSDSPGDTSGWSAALSRDYALLGVLGSDNGAAYLYNLAPAITWVTPAPIAEGTPLSDTQLNASVGSVPGIFNYDAPEELPLGRTTVTASFTPTDIARYAPASKKATIVVFPPIDAIDDLFVLPVQEEWVGADPVPTRRFLPLHNDQFKDSSSTAGYMLRVKKIEHVAELSKTGESMITIALVANSEVHIRIFDGAGAMVFDLPESGLIGGQLLTVLREDLTTLPENPILTGEDIEILKTIASYLTGFSPGLYFETASGLMDTLVTPEGATAYTAGREIFYSGYDTPQPGDTFTYHIRDGGRTDSATITIRTLLPGDTGKWRDYGPVIGGWLGLAGRLADQSAAPGLTSRAEFFRKIEDELYALAINYPGIGGGAQLGYGITMPPGEEEPKGLLSQISQLLLPGIIGVVTNPGEATLITAEMVETTRALVGLMASLSTDDDLKSTLLSTLAFDDADLIGMSFSEFAKNIGVSEGPLQLPVTKVAVDFPSFSVTTLNLAGVAYSLSKSTSIAPDSWQTVTHTETVDPAGTITLTDPNATGSKAFYKIIVEKAPGAAAAASD